jgi:hypothetical protein
MFIVLNIYFLIIIFTSSFELGDEKGKKHESLG